MKLFDDIIGEIRDYIDKRESAGAARRFRVTGDVAWPAAGDRDIVLQADTGVELGNPRDESVAFLVWTSDESRVRDGEITLIGPDIGECAEGRLVFGRAVLVAGAGFNEENNHDRYREMELLRYDVSLRGYMMRAVSQYMREWSRVSREAKERGFSFSILGEALVEQFRTRDYVGAVEVLFVTKAAEDVRELRGIGERAMRYINAMNKMIEEMDFDCGSCDYQDVCGEAGDLLTMRNSLKKAKDAKLN